MPPLCSTSAPLHLLFSLCRILCPQSCLWMTLCYSVFSTNEIFFLVKPLLILEFTIVSHFQKGLFHFTTIFSSHHLKLQCSCISSPDCCLSAIGISSMISRTLSVWFTAVSLEPNSILNEWINILFFFLQVRKLNNHSDYYNNNNGNPHLSSDFKVSDIKRLEKYYFTPFFNLRAPLWGR